MTDPLQLLRTYYGYTSFRPLQREIIEHVVSGADSLVLMPTGGGKSVCFQIPALMLEGTAIVVSPLISLMKDQVEALRINGIAAGAINSNNDEHANRELFERMAAGALKLVYVSPERLIADIDIFARQHISMIAIDEAHCISQWGHDFRPEYTQLGTLRDRFVDIPIIALTATADKITKNDIVEQLHLRNPRMFINSFDRPNLSLDVKAGFRKSEKLRAIINLVNRHRGESGIIYCLSRKGTEQLAAELRAKGLSVAAYHAGLPTAQRNRVQEDFINDRIDIICATIAFGMGIDKSNVRYVVHYNMPKSIESFYQEIGRAGRDGLPSETMLFYNIQDIITLQSFVEASGQRDINQEKLNRMKEYAEAKVCRRRILLNYFGETSEHACGNCDVCRNPPQLFDGTILVQKALSAIMRTDQQIGFTMLIDILRGSLSTEVRARGYQHIKTFGAGRDIPASHWQKYFLQMLQMGYLEIAYNEDRHLKVTDLGREVLRGKSVQLALVTNEDFGTKKTKQAKAVREKKSAPVVHGRESKALFEVLRQLRTTIAGELGVPPYVIFSDRTLHALATERPVTREAFARVWGVGEHKVTRFADRFITQIKPFASASTPDLPFD